MNAFLFRKPKRSVARIHRPIRSLAAAAAGLALLWPLGWLAGGCVSSPGEPATSPVPAMPKPGRGLAEYRELTHDAYRAVAVMMKPLRALARPNAPASAAHPALPDFDRALHQLELASLKTRARAEAIIARGDAYFDEWKQNLAGLTNEAAVRFETEHYARLHEHFQRVRERSGDVRAEFRPFMAKLREFRATLDKSPNPTGHDSALAAIDDLVAGGGRVLETLRALSGALDDAERELRAIRAGKERNGESQ